MRFATDATLGKLGRHLRAAGFDTVCQHESRNSVFFNTIEADRIILTRSCTLLIRFNHHPLVFIRDNDPFQQMLQVMQELDIRQSDMKPFSRCLICNLETTPVDKQTLGGKVPAYIWQHHQTFRVCRGCKRIYWAGSHHDRLRTRFDMLFKPKGSTNP
jgi:uncharacterized protein with PIN domain